MDVKVLFFARSRELAGASEAVTTVPAGATSLTLLNELMAKGYARMQQRTFAEKAVAAEVDWDSISGLVHSDEGKRELVALRTTFMDIQNRLTGMAKDTPAPNWAAWKKDLDPKIVDGFKQAFETMKLPSYSGNDVAQAQAQFAEIMQQAEAFAASSAARAKEVEAELAGIQKEKERIATVTVDEELAADPKMAAEIDSEVEKNSFLVTP